MGFGARLRDWARVGRLIAQRGEMNGHRIVSEAWIDECVSPELSLLLCMVQLNCGGCARVARITSWEGDSDQNVLWAKGKHANSTVRSAHDAFCLRCRAVPRPSNPLLAVLKSLMVDGRPCACRRCWSKGCSGLGTKHSCGISGRMDRSRHSPATTAR